MPEILSQGLCECIAEPRGDHGLEGYNLGETYKYAHMDKDKNGHPYYRVYPQENSTYYETCGPNVFKAHFKLLPVGRTA